MTPPNGSGSSISERAQNGSSSGIDADPQEGMFDKHVDDADLEAALEAREAAREIKLSAGKDFKTKDTVVKGHLAGFNLAVGEVARIGRFKISKKRYAGNSISFETAPREQLSIEATD